MKMNHDKLRWLRKKRWYIYVTIGVIFGIVDYYLQALLQQNQPVSIIAIFGVWIIPLLPVALYESWASRRITGTILASILTWSTAIVSYYVYMFCVLVFFGTVSRPELYIGHISEPYYWTNVSMVFTGDGLGGIVEWLMVAIFGGGVLGACIGFLYRLILPKEQSKATLENKQENIKE